MNSPFIFPKGNKQKKRPPEKNGTLPKTNMCFPKNGYFPNLGFSFYLGNFLQPFYQGETRNGWGFPSDFRNGSTDQPDQPDPTNLQGSSRDHGLDSSLQKQIPPSLACDYHHRRNRPNHFVTQALAAGLLGLAGKVYIYMYMDPR